MRQVLPTIVAVLALAAAASAQTPAGPEFQVNTYTTDAQSRVRPAMARNGDFVAVWASAYQDGDAGGLFGQQFAASGAPRGSEFAINTYTTGHQSAPAVAAGPRGDFIVVWQSVEDGSGTSIRGRRFETSGATLGDAFAVNDFTTGSQDRPRVGRAPDGRFVVTWTSPIDGSSLGVAGRRFDAAGSPVGGEFVVNTYTTGDQQESDVAVEANGNFVVVWEDRSNDRDGSLHAVFGQRFDASGNRLGSEFQVNTYTTGRQIKPSISVSPEGGFVVAWTSEPGDGSGYAMFARLFDGTGSPVGDDFVVNTATTGSQYGSPGQVAHDELGNFVVTWEGPDSDSAGIFAQRFSASGVRRGAEFQVSTFTTARQEDPSVASDAVGNFVVTWTSQDQDGSDRGAFAQRVGGLAPATLTLGTPGHQMLEPGQTAELSPAWRNFTGSAQSFSGILASFTGPAGAVYTIDDGVGDYGTVGAGLTRNCIDCYTVSVSDPVSRPVMHWDARVVERILPDTLGQNKQWALHLGGSFADVPASSPFYFFIETLLHAGVTSGCTPTEYCPAQTTTREQMAVFVLVTKEGAGYVPPACVTPLFADVPAGNPFCRWIEELARRGVVGGCGGGNYCPASPVTREQMAIFVLRTLDGALTPPACTTPLYGDVPAASGFCRWIEELTRRGVVTGCGGGNYCPTASVTREQMGVFLWGTFGLTLYGP